MRFGGASHMKGMSALAAASPVETPGYEPFPVERRAGWREPVDAALRRRLPRRGYVPLLHGYHRARRLAGRNPGRGRLLPDFVIIGAAKAGTTSLYAWLAMHPFVARCRVKEVDYFSFHYYRGEDWYRGHFPLARDREAFAAQHGRPFLTGEGSPSYLWQPAVPERLAALLPSAKLIVALRDPVERAYSQFQMRRRDGEEPVESFLEAVALEDPGLDRGRARAQAAARRNGTLAVGRTYLERSRYVEELAPWFDRFAADQFHIVTTQALAADPHSAFDRLQDFLELPRHTPETLQARFTSSYAPLEEDARVVLSDYFRPHNERLYQLLGQDLGWT